MQLIGQKSNLDIIDSWSKVPNFLIIQGDEHTGKKYLTLYLCDKFKLHYMNIKNSAKSVRELTTQMSENKNMLYHLDNFHLATAQAKNALLKVTEETPQGNYIVITGGPQIQTLESRARKLIMQPYSYEELESYMSNYYDKDKLNELYIAGINTPAKIEYYSKVENMNNLLEYSYEIFSKLTYITPDDFIPMIQRFEDRYDNIDMCMLFLNMLISIIENKITKDTYYSYKNILDKLVEGKNQLRIE